MSQAASSGSGPASDCPECGGRFDDGDDPRWLHCRTCGNRMHEAAAEIVDELEVVADMGGDVGEIAQALLDASPEAEA